MSNNNESTRQPHPSLTGGAGGGSKVQNLIVRTLTGIVFVAVMIGGILYSPLTFGVLFTIITCLSVWEFTGVVNHRADVSVNRMIATVAAGCLFVGFFGYAAGIAGAGVLFVPWRILFICATTH